MDIERYSYHAWHIESLEESSPPPPASAPLPARRQAYIHPGASRKSPLLAHPGPAPVLEAAPAAVCGRRSIDDSFMDS